MGRLDEGAKMLDEALAFSRQLKNDGLVAQALNWQGDNFWYRGDRASAKSLYEQAVQTATKTTDRHLLLLSRLNSAKVTLEEGQAQAVIKKLKDVADETQTLGLKYLSIECSIYEADAKLRLKDYTGAQQQLERTDLQIENLGLRPLRLLTQFSLGKLFKQKGEMAEATPHYRQVVDLLDTLRKEPGAEKIMERADFKAMYQEAGSWLREHP
jgi:predicted negative regulator of RcsB-dependent stress response